MTTPVSIKILPADNFEPLRYTLSDDNYKKIYTRTPDRDVAFIKIRNTSTSDSIYIANSNKVADTNTDQLDAGGVMEEWVNPDEIYAKRSGSNTITVIVTVFYYDPVEE